jgi:peptidoglycan-N-acetylglucosamine deacetylase
MIQKRFFLSFLLLLGGAVLAVGYRRPDFAGKVHISFDDGATPEETTKLLAILARYRVPASFFEVGNRLTQLPNNGRALLAAKRAGGHVIGNHSFTHPHFPQLSREDIAKELHDTEMLLADFSTLKLVRPPYGDDDERGRAILRELGYVRVKWDVQGSEFSAGWEEEYRSGVAGTRERYIQHIVEKLQGKNGGILLLHDESTLPTIDSLPALIEELQHQGFTFVPLEYFLEVRRQ